MDHGGEGLMRVRLLTDRFRIREGNKIRYFTKGDVFEAGESQGQRLVKIGAAVVDGGVSPQVDELTEAPTVGSAEPAVIEMGPDKPESSVNRPPNAANRESWDNYARAMRVDPSAFKSKEELIAAIPE